MVTFYSNNKIIVPNNTPSGNGLFLTSQYLVTTIVVERFQSNGNFLFKHINNLVSFGTTVDGGDGHLKIFCTKRNTTLVVHRLL